MSPLFGKKPKDKRSSLIGDAWTVSKGKYDGKEIIIRFNSFYRKFKGRSEYKFQVGIAIPLHNPDPGGLPSSEENAELLEVEDVIASSLEDQGKALFVAAITTGIMKEFVFYTLDPEVIKQRFEALQKKITSHEIQLMIQLDKDWNVYKKLEP